MCMRATEEGCILAEQQKEVAAQQMELKDKVNQMDGRLTKVETEMKDSRDENRRGFDDIKKQLGYIYAEKAEWGKWAREHLGKAMKWIGWIVLAACGINQTSEVLKFFFDKS